MYSGRIAIKSSSIPAGRFAPTLWDFVHIDPILQAQDEAGVDKILLAPWVTLLRYDAEPEEGLRISRIQNEGLAKIAQEHPDRVRVLGTVPLQDPDLAASELEHVMTLPGMKGVEIASSVNGTFLGDKQFLPFWDAAESAGALVFIHPTTRGFLVHLFLTNSTCGTPSAIHSRPQSRQRIWSMLGSWRLFQT